MKVLIKDLNILLKVIYITILKLFYLLKAIYKTDLINTVSTPAVN
jgi:hypothetical protein